MLLIIRLVLINIVIFILAGCNSKYSTIKYDGVGVFDSYRLNGDKKKPQKEKTGYLAGSIGHVISTDLGSDYYNTNIYIKRTNESERFLALTHDRDELAGSDIDFKTLEYQVGTFYIPLEEGNYEISGVNHYGLSSSAFSGYMVLKSPNNKIKTNISISIKKDEVTYIGQYLAKSNGVFVVIDELQRDKNIIFNKIKKNVGEFVNSVPEFNAGERNLFQNAKSGFYGKLHKLRIKEEEENTGD